MDKIQMQITDETTVKELMNEFKQVFGCTLRVYNDVLCREGFADEEATLRSLSQKKDITGELKVTGSKGVPKLEEEFAKKRGLGIRLYNGDCTYAFLWGDMSSVRRNCGW